ncbi:MAG TPA: MMPL family transporter [Actinomycetes bacterium]|nr:MMPL family transporter [Actinomycetes bacterium]
MTSRGTQRSSRARLLVPVLLVLGWLVLGGIAGPLAGKVSEVQENDNAAFLPASAESTRALALEEAFTGSETVPALVVWERPGGLTPGDLTAVEAATARIGDLDGVAGPPSPVLRSEDGEAARVVLPLPGEDSLDTAAPTVEQVRELAADVPAGVASHVTGPGGFVADLSAAFEGIDGLLLVVTAAVVLVILVAVYRSPVFVPVLLAAGLALGTAQAAAYLLAKNDVITLNGQSAGILLVLVFGAGTDYALLLISRFKEELHAHEHSWDAMRVAWRATVGPVVASGSTVVLGLLCLLLSDLNSNKSLGPTAATGIVAAMLAMLTFLPAALLLLGRRWFWPRQPRPGAQTSDRRGLWAGVARLVGRRPVAVMLVTTAVLAVAAGFSARLDAGGIAATEQFTTEVDSVAGQEVLVRHFPGGTGSPVNVYGPAGQADRLLDLVAGASGIGDAALLPREVDGRVAVQATLSDPPDSPAAEQTVRDLRTAVDAVSADVLVGGTTAIDLDVKDESARDNRVIIPVVLVVIFVVLALLLRSLVAPVLLVATVVLSFFATLGVCALVFQDVLGFAGADPSFPLFAFVFLVALGIDYNIFLMTRVREESQRVGTRRGTLRGLAVTGGVITSAGVVLAATFSALGVLPLVPLAQIGFAVAFGVLLDTLVVRSLLVPSVTYLLGPPTWWPGRLARVPDQVEPA